MIIGIKKAILHILDGLSGITVFSDEELDSQDASIINFITTHMEKSYDDPALRNASFKSASGLKYHLSQYLAGEEDFIALSRGIAERLYEGIGESESPESCDLIVADCVASEKPVLAILKCDNKIGYTHQVIQEEGEVRNTLINHYAILPALSQRISECAFIGLDDMSVRYKGKKHKIAGESVDLIAELLLECDYDISSKESTNTFVKLAKNVTRDNGGDELETAARMKRYITDNIEELEYIEPEKLAGAVFEGRPAMHDEFMAKLNDAEVPEKVEINKYVTKKLSSNIKITTDIGVEISFPAEFYRDSEYVEIINNPDGTLSVKINNIGEIISK